SALTKNEWDPAVATSNTTSDRIFHIYTDNAGTSNDDVVIEGVTLAYGKTFEEDLGVDPADADFHYYFRRAGGAIALGAAANVVHINTTLEGAENANAGGLGGSTGGESGNTDYTLTLNGVVVEDSIAQGDGGGLYLAAPTTATNLVVRNNRSTTNGGGIYNEADTNISQATFSGNIAEGGGGIFTTGSNIVKITRSTFTANRAIGGGAISNRKGVTIELENSTLSGNIARDVGAGLYTNGSVFLDFVTVADNLSGADSPSSGSGINPFPAGSGAVMTLKNVLLSGNKKGLPYDPLDATTDPTSDTFALPDATYIASLPPSNCGTTSGGSGITVASLGHNISGDVTCYSATTVLWFGDTSDINNMDPKIGPLAANGGLTLTHALLSDSPAIGAGAASAGITVDQRGVTRDTPPDIGAYELPASTSTGGGGSSGGCVYDPNGSSDWTLLILLAAGIGGLLIRHRRKDATKQ
ncbi:MAG: choice-of-anchor Q domain-containing protein, partial [Gammaproteobacteria bacterium]